MLTSWVLIGILLYLRHWWAVEVYLWYEMVVVIPIAAYVNGEFTGWHGLYAVWTYTILIMLIIWYFNV